MKAEEAVPASGRVVASQPDTRTVDAHCPGGLIRQVAGELVETSPDPEACRQGAPPSRRVFLGAAILTSLAASKAASAKPGHPDAKLLGLLGRFAALQREINGYWVCGIGENASRGPNYIEDEDEREAATVSLIAQQDPIIDQVCALRPATIEGCHALAVCLLLWDHDMLAWVEGTAECGGSWNERLLVSLLRGLMPGGLTQ